MISTLVLFMGSSAALSSIRLGRSISTGNIYADTDENVAVRFQALPGYENILVQKANGSVSFNVGNALSAKQQGLNPGAKVRIGTEGAECFSVTNNSDLAISVTLMDAVGGIALVGDRSFLVPGQTGKFYFTIDTEGVEVNSSIGGKLRVSNSGVATFDGTVDQTEPQPPLPLEPLPLSPVVFYDFSQPLPQTDLIYKTNDFIRSQDSNGVVSRTGYFFAKNPNEEYTISTKAKLYKDYWSEYGTSGGYGLMFDTTLDQNHLDSGYSLQFDRAVGSVIIRKRVAGKEDYSVYMPSATHADNPNIIPESKRDPWWTAEHVFALEVTKATGTPNTRRLAVYIDGVKLNYSFTFESTSTVDTGYTGYRTWNTDTLFRNLEIKGK